MWEADAYLLPDGCKYATVGDIGEWGEPTVMAAGERRRTAGEQVGSSTRGDNDDVSGLRHNIDECVLLLSSQQSKVSISSDRSLWCSLPDVAIDRLCKTRRQIYVSTARCTGTASNRTGNAGTAISDGCDNVVY